MVGWHHRRDGHEFEKALGVGERQQSLACCSSWGGKELDITEWLNWTELYCIFWTKQMTEQKCWIYEVKKKDNNNFFSEHNLKSTDCHYLYMPTVLTFLLQLGCCLVAKSYLTLFVTLWTVACQAPLSMGFSRQEYWNGSPFPSPGASSQPRNGACDSCRTGGFFTTGKPSTRIFQNNLEEGIFSASGLSTSRMRALNFDQLTILVNRSIHC